MPIALNQIPNILTVLRILLVIPFALSVYYDHFRQALLIFFVAGLSDGVDGFLARQFNWKSRFGAIADPLADKLLLITAYLALAMSGELPWWLTLMVLGRDVLIVLGALSYHFFIGPYDIKPSWAGKTCTLIQIVFVLAVIMSLAELPMPDWVLQRGQSLVTTITLFSGIHYYVVWGRRGWREKHESGESS